MNILMPLWNLNVLYIGYFSPLIRAISEQLDPHSDEFHVVYFEGQQRQEWRLYCSFHKFGMPYDFVRSKMVRFYLSRKRILSQMKNVNADVLFTPSEVWGQEFSRYGSHKMGIPYVVWLRGDSMAVRKIMGTNPVKERVLNYLETRSLKDASLVIPCSMDLARKTGRWRIKKERMSEPVYNGVDTDLFRPMDVERTREFTIAYAGRVSPEKGIHRLLKLAENLSGVHVLIAGEKEMNISFPSDIEYMGPLPFSEMPQFYNKADLIVLPSFTEGFPNVILEAYACAKPVLVSKEVFPEELKVFGSVCRIDEFGSEINRLRKLDLKTLGSKARSHIKRQYSWKKFGQSIVEHLRSVLE